MAVDEKALNGFVGRECPAAGFRAAVGYRGAVKAKGHGTKPQPSADCGLGIRALQPRGIALHGSSIKMRPAKFDAPKKDCTTRILCHTLRTRFAMNGKKCDIGIVGLGVMGSNLALNIADHHFSVAAYNRDAARAREFLREAGASEVVVCGSLGELAASVREPRAVMLMVTAGAAVKAVAEELLPHLKKGDVIVDGGNSFYKDTDLREQYLKGKGIHFIGCGVSGGEEGARHGTSLMPGGEREGYERVRPVFEAIAAKVGKEPCVAYLGRGASGHFVKMVHNGIEYGVMQLIAETYDLMARGLEMKNSDIARLFEQWNRKEHSSYLIEITAKVLAHVDKKSGDWLVNLIQDVARQKGTGIWTSASGLELQCPVPTIDAAVAMRHLSVWKNERDLASRQLKWPHHFRGEREPFITQLGNALYAATIITYAQGMSLLAAASQFYKYDLNLADVARIWRGGCIIRAALLDKIRVAYKARPDLHNLLMSPQFGAELMARQSHLRNVVGKTVHLGIPASAFAASLSYFDAYRSARLPANLIQAQRDYFGAHTYERIDQKGTFHTKWD